MAPQRLFFVDVFFFTQQDSGVVCSLDEAMALPPTLQLLLLLLLLLLLPLLLLLLLLLRCELAKLLLADFRYGQQKKWLAIICTMNE